MRKKYITLLLSATLALFLFSGCGEADKGIKTRSQEFRNEENAVYGEVSEITEDNVTIKVGTQKKDAQPEERASMLELTGEEKEIEITENTIINRRTMGGRAGNMSENEQPNGEIQSGERPEQPNGEDQPGEPPSGEPPEQPNGNIPSGEFPERSSEKDIPRDHAEKIRISDILEGDFVRVVFAEDGSTEEITVISANMNQTEESSQLI